MDEKKDRTYLVVLSLLIICIEVFGITFDKINLLGNVANVPDESVGILIFIIWLYFVWSFYQNYGFNMRIHRDSLAYLDKLDRITRSFLENKAKKENYDLNKYHIVDIRRAESSKNGLHIKVLEDDGMGGSIEATPFLVLNKELRWYRFRSYLAFIFRGNEFREKLFPYILMLLVILVGYIGVLDYISWLFQK